MSDPILNRLASDMVADALHLISEDASDLPGLHPVIIEALLLAHGNNAHTLPYDLLEESGLRISFDFIRRVICRRQHVRTGVDSLKRLWVCKLIAEELARSGFSYKDVWGFDDPCRGGV